MMRGGEPFRHLRAEIQHIADRQRRPRQELAQRGPLDDLRHDVRRALVDADVVYRDDIGMVERAGGLRFAGEPTLPRRIGSRLCQDLDRDVAFQSRVARAIHFAHAARAEGGEHLIGTEMTRRR